MRLGLPAQIPPRSAGRSRLQSTTLCLRQRSAVFESAPEGWESVGNKGLASKQLTKYTKQVRAVGCQAAAAAGSQPLRSQPTSETWKGIKILPAIGSIAVGLAVRYLVPVPDALTTQAWSLLSIFLSTIVALVLEPLPVGACAFIAATVCLVTQTLTFPAAFGAFRNDVIWMIVVSFFFARGFEKTGLGERIANLFVKWFGKSTLGLSYGLTFAETLICPAMPSTSARAGGIFNPIIISLSKSAGSEPGPTAKKIGRYLTMAQLQSSSFSSCLYMTGAAQNLLCLKLAAELGVNVGNPFMTWIMAACVPCVLFLVVSPLLVYKLSPPEVKDTPEAPVQAEKKLKAMGPMGRDQQIMLGTLLGAVTLWMFGDFFGVAPVVAAMLGLCTLLMTGVLTWKDCLGHSSAWDTLTWFAILVGLSGQLNEMGVIKVFSESVGSALLSLNMSWPALFAVLNGAYFMLHYFFASQTAHVGALYSAFLALMLAAGAPGLLSALVLAFTSNLFGAISHYASGQAAIYFGSGYLDLKQVFALGAIFVVLVAFVWYPVGFAWWKLIGLV